jgi:hypothetical protein
MQVILPANVMISSSGLLYVICKGWTEDHPEDMEMSLRPLLRKILRTIALNGGGTMVVLGKEDVVHSYGVMVGMEPNG